MSTIQVSPPAGRSQFPAAVQRRSWEWLLALRRRLNVDLEIVDDRQEPLLAPPPSPISANIPGFLAAGAPGLREAISTVMQTGTRQGLSIDAVQVVCVPLTVGRTVEGALILAQQRADSVSAERARGALDLMGFWLSNAVEAHLASPSSEEGDLDRLSSLCRLLDDSTTHRSDRDIVTAFSEALAIWHDLETYGYIETARGEFVREVSLAGVDPSKSPQAIQRTSLPEGAVLHRISRLDVERLGFSNDQDLVMMRLADKAGAWVIVVCGAISSSDIPKLGRYFSLLEQAIGRASGASTSRVVAAMARHLLDDGQPVEGQARRALDEVQDALGMSSAALSISSASRAPLVSVGSAPPIAEAGDLVDGRHLTISRRLPQHYTMSLVAEWPVARRVTRHEHQVAHAAADLFESWARRIVRQARDPGERRSAARSYDQDLERFAEQAVGSGIPVTAVVLSFSDAALKPGATQARIVRLREKVRPTDIVGRLGDGEIGMLLHNAPGGEARAVTARLRRALQEGNGLESSVKVSVGYATREPGQMKPGPLAQEAREDALRDIGESRQ
jgi:hypothetical protein